MRKPGDANKYLHCNTWILAVLCSTVYMFGMTFEVSSVFICKCFDSNTRMGLMFQLLVLVQAV